MNPTVPTFSIVCIAISALAGIAIPTALFLVFRKKYRADILPFFVGCAVFLLFASLIEHTINRYILLSDAGTVLQSSVWLYSAFFGLMAGLFEETGRFVAFQTVLKKKLGNDSNALMYGAGHGGVEVFYLLVTSMVTNLYFAFMLNSGRGDALTAGVTDPATLQTIRATLTTLSSIPSTMYLVSIVERISAVALHISLSVLVWFAVKERGKKLWYFPLAILLHALVDAAAVITASYASSIWVSLGATYVITACIVVFACFVWKRSASVKRVAAAR